MNGEEGGGELAGHERDGSEEAHHIGHLIFMRLKSSRISTVVLRCAWPVDEDAPAVGAVALPAEPAPAL